MPSTAHSPLMEMPAQKALEEDHARLRDAFREAVAVENAGWAAAAAHYAELAQTRQDLEQMRAERDRLQDDLNVTLASPTWRAGRIVTALPRRIRDRRAQ